MSQRNAPITGRAIRISEMAVTSFVIKDQTFEDCLIIGPAVLAATGDTSFVNCTFDGEVDALLWEIPPSRPEIMGGIQVDNCTFLRCRFQIIGLAGPKEFTDLFRSQIKEGSQ